VATFKKIECTDEFKRDFKRLKRLYPTLDEDLDEFIDTQLMLAHKLHRNNDGVFPISGTGYQQAPCYIAKKFTCRSLFGTGVQSGIRVVYVYWKDEDEIVFIEIFHKNTKELHDKRRLARYLGQHAE
jgi:hypothetical protein